jgi:hypothetical protein
MILGPQFSSRSVEHDGLLIFLRFSVLVYMQNGSFEMLAGQVEADEAFIGGRAEFMHRKRREELFSESKYAGKTIVLGILERAEAEGESQVYASVIPDRLPDTLQQEICANVEVGSEVCTDDHPAYRGLGDWFVHSSVNYSANEYVNGDTHTNGIENFWTLLKRSIRGTYVSVESDHLFRYLDEQAFRFNERKGDGNDRERFIKAASQIGEKRLTYKQLIDRGGAFMPRRGRMPKLNAKT